MIGAFDLPNPQGRIPEYLRGCNAGPHKQKRRFHTEGCTNAPIVTHKAGNTPDVNRPTWELKVMEIILMEFGTHLGKNGERFIIKHPKEPPVEVPAEDVKAIIIAGKGIGMSIDAIALALEHDIPIILLTFSGEPYGHIVPPSSLGNAVVRLEQLRAFEDGRGALLAATMLKGKLKNQAATLRYFAKSRHDSSPDTHKLLHDLAETIDHIARQMVDTVDQSPAPVRAEDVRSSLMTLEAQAARHYWNGVARILPGDIGFPGRERRGATDPFNCCLNYAYAVLYGRINPVLIIAGLDPYLGYLHALENGKPALLFDFIEEFRQFVVDRMIIGSFTKKWRPQFEENGKLDQETRKHLAKRVLERLADTVEYQGKHITINDLIKAKAYEIVRFIKNLEPHVPYVAPW